MRSRGFTLAEILLVTGLLAVVGLAVTQLFRVTMNVQRDTAAAHDVLSRTVRLNDQLRRDVWRAAAIEPAETGVRLIDANGAVILYRTRTVFPNP